MGGCCGLFDGWKNNLQGSTPTCGLYRARVKAYVVKCIADPKTKRLNLVIGTDVVPSDT